MPKAKDKVMLQFPVDEKIALAWKEMCKGVKRSQGQFFTELFIDFMTEVQKVVKKNTKIRKVD